MSPIRRARARTVTFLAAAAVALSLLCGTPAGAMRSVGGKDKLTSDAGWPDGVLAVANLPSRFIFSSGDGGDTELLYRGNADAFQQALAALAAVRAPAVELYVHDGPHVHWIAKAGKDDGIIDWTFTVWNPQQWHELFNAPHGPLVADGPRPVPPPRVDVYVGDPAAGGIDWRAVKLPDAIRVIDQRAASQKVRPAGGAMIRGTLYDMANGKTIPAIGQVEAQMMVDKEWETVCQGATDNDGAFSIDKIPAGSYRVLATAPGYAPRAILYAKFAQTTFTQLDGELSAEVTVKGTVTDDQGKPLAGVGVRPERTLGIDGRGYAIPERAEVTTDAAGHFSFEAMPTGYATFYCSAKGLTQLDARTPQKLASWNVIVDRGRTVKPTGQTPVVLRMATPGAIRAKVTAADGKAPKADLYVTVADAAGGYSHGRGGGWQRSVPIKADGTVDFADVPPGRYYVATGYQVDFHADAAIVTVAPGKTAELDISDR